MSYRAVFFDAGETLVHPHPSFPELFELILRREGHRIDPALLRDGISLVTERFADAARTGEVWSSSPERSRAFWLRVYRDLLERVGLPDGEVLSSRLYVEFTDLANYRLFPDVPAALQGLRSAGMRLGVVSNFEEWLERLLEQLGVAGYFEVQVISGVEGIEKPDPRIFRLALQRAGVEPADAVYVGDNPEFDTEAAEALGMLGVLIDRRGRHPGHAGIRITSLAELPSAIGLSA